MCVCPAPFISSTLQHEIDVVAHGINAQYAQFTPEFPPKTQPSELTARAQTKMPTKPRRAVCDRPQVAKKLSNIKKARTKKAAAGKTPPLTVCVPLCFRV